jgi:hypothetical protein
VMCELLHGACHADVQCVQEHSVSYHECGGRGSMLVVVPHHVLLRLCEGCLCFVSVDFMQSANSFTALSFKGC